MLRVALLIVSTLLITAPFASAQDPTGDQRDFFEKKIKPVLVENCFKCHSHEAKKLKGALLLDSRAAILQGGDNGPAIDLQNPTKSRLLEALHYKNPDLQMPPKAKLPDAVIADIEQWVKDGAPWPGDQGKLAAKYAFDLAKRKAEHWAWQPVKPTPPPAVKNAAWPRDPVDRFLLAKLEEKNLKPAPDADRRTLIRRLYFDLIGLPPSPAEVEAFVKDATPQAVEKLVDELLSRAQFGERWGRHWLDLVRYAESRGHEFDYTNPNAYQYRDYVIRALNADVPYNQFVKEHLAGDLLPKPRLHPKEGWNESIIGTGFYFMGEQVHSPVDTTADKADRFDNTIDVIGKTFLGLTVACARCHDHKFDAISQKDYYALFGFLESSSYRLAPFETMEHNRKVAEELAVLRKRASRAIQAELVERRDLSPTAFVDHVMAAGEAIRSKTGEAALKDLANGQKLDIGLIQRWMQYLPIAAKDKSDAFHFLARVLTDSKLCEVKDLAKTLQAEFKVLESTAFDNELFFPDESRIADYRTGKVNEGISAVSKLNTPVTAGALQWTKGNKPRFSFTEFGAFQFGEITDRVKPASGSENDPGRLGQVVRAGNSIRTPTFPIRDGKVYYLVKGAGLVYAGVDGHAMLEGPLHGQLVRSFKTGDAFQWVEHDLTPYKGKRAFLEFSPLPTSVCAVAKVVQSDTKPSPLQPFDSIMEAMGHFLSKSEHTTERVTELLGPPKGTAHLLTQLHVLLLTHAIPRSIMMDGIDNPEPRELAHNVVARLANWMVTHGELLERDPQALESRLAKAAAPLLAEESKLIAQIKKQSRLSLGILDGSGVDEFLYIRGNHKTPGEVVPRRFLEAFAGPKPLAAKQGSGRLELAQQVVDPKVNPLVARVIVNRLWHHLFGRGIVASTDNFGVLGERPTHPELLDHLADRFVKEGWSVKKMIRNLVLTRAYQMSSQRDDKAEQVDPTNALLHRANLRRLEGETIRDAILSVSGRLDLKQFGPSVPVALTPFQDGRGKPASGPLDGNGRRSVYLAVRRNFLSSFLLAFDMPTPFSTVGKRNVSNVPAQALILMNDPFVHQQAVLWGKRMQNDKKSPAERVALMYETAFSRPPTEMESRRCLEFLEANANNWGDLAHVLINAKEFIYLP